MVVNYQLGKIYKIVDNTNGNIYIGSTCEPTLARRLSGHLVYFRQNRYSTCCEILKNNDYDIFLLENYPCETKDQLIARERHYIENLNCVNKNIPGRTQNEYRLANKSRINKRCREYRKKNRSKIQKIQDKYYNNNKDKITQPIDCICGSTVQKCNKCEHKKSMKHKKFVHELNQILKYGNQQIKLANELINEVRNIKPIKI